MIGNSLGVGGKKGGYGAKMTDSMFAVCTLLGQWHSGVFIFNGFDDLPVADIIR